MNYAIHVCTWLTGYYVYVYVYKVRVYSYINLKKGFEIESHQVFIEQSLQKAHYMFSYSHF